MRGCAVLMAVSLAAGLLRADTVYLIDTDMCIEGKVHRETPEFIILLVHNEAGQIRIPRSKIKRIEYDIKTQLEKLGADDFAGRYKVALWALEKGMLAEAVELMEALKGKEGPGPEMIKLLAKAYDKRGQLDRAYKNYADYKQVHPDDQEVAARLEELKKQLHIENGGEAAGVPKVEEGLEKDGTWVSEKWEDANPSALQLTVEPATGNKVVFVKGDGGQKPKTAFSRTGAALNLETSKDMVFRVFLDSPAPVSLAIAYSNAKGEFFESIQQRVSPNSWNKMSFSVDAKNFKAQKNEWKHTLPLEGKDSIGRIYFLVYGQRPFTMYADSVFFTAQQ